MAKFRVETNGLGVVRNRLVVVALSPVGDTTIVVCLGEVGIEADGLGVVRDRLVVVALGLIGETTEVVCSAKSGLRRMASV